MISENSAFHTALFDALCACLNLNRNSAEAAALIREAYAEPENKNDLVKGLQEKLQSLGYTLGICGVDGDFGLATEAAVKAFQRDHGLEADGIVGKNTYAMLEEVLAEPDWLEDGGRYSVIISGLDLTQAQRLQQNYPGSVIEKEMG